VQGDQKVSVHLTITVHHQVHKGFWSPFIISTAIYALVTDFFKTLRPSEFITVHKDPVLRSWISSTNIKISILILSSELLLDLLIGGSVYINPLNAKLNPICYLLALLGIHHFLHVSRIRVKSLTLRLLMSYIYIYAAHILDVSRSHTTTRHSR
jgi:hypothetical protein